jgi:hypothetical protein
VYLLNSYPYCDDLKQKLLKNLLILCIDIMTNEINLSPSVVVVSTLNDLRVVGRNLPRYVKSITYDL